MDRLILGYIPEILLFITIIYTFLTISSVRRYRREHTQIKELVNRCIECKAIVINHIVLDSTYSKDGLLQASKILAGFQNVSNLPFEYACTEVTFDVNGEMVQTMILRQASFKKPKCYDDIKSYYDPYNPKQAFEKDMKGILLYKSFRDCIIYSIVAVVCALAFIFISIL